MFCTDTASVVWRAAETLSLFQNKQRTLDTGEKPAAPQEHTEHCHQQSYTPSQQEQNSTPFSMRTVKSNSGFWHWFSGQAV